MPRTINVFADADGTDVWAGAYGEVWYESVPEPPELLGSFRVGSLSMSDSSSVGSLVIGE